MGLTIDTKQLEAYIDQCVSSQVAQLKEELLQETQTEAVISNDIPKYSDDDYLTTKERTSWTTTTFLKRLFIDGKKRCNCSLSFAVRH